MAELTRQPEALTLDEFLHLPEAKPALEYVDGRVRQKVSPRPKHAGLQAYFIKYFDAAGMPRKLARALSEVRCTFAGRSRVPDVAVFRWARIPRDPHGELGDECRYAPDIVVEIMSPGQSIASLTRDGAWYVDNGVTLALLLLPGPRSIRVFAPGQPMRELTADDVLDFSPIIPGATLTVREVYASLAVD